jgi:hypothetical protein
MYPSLFGRLAPETSMSSSCTRSFHASPQGRDANPPKHLMPQNQHLAGVPPLSCPPSCTYKSLFMLPFGGGTPNASMFPYATSCQRASRPHHVYNELYNLHLCSGAGRHIPKTPCATSHKASYGVPPRLMYIQCLTGLQSRTYHDQTWTGKH